MTQATELAPRSGSGGIMTLTKADAAHLRHSLTSWGESSGLAEPLPDGVACLIPAAIASMDARLAAVVPHVLAGLLQRLWDGGVPQPHETTIFEWRRLLGIYPEAVLAAAFDQVVKSHRWPDPPKIADVMKFVGPEMARLLAWKHKLEKARVRADIEAQDQADAERRRRDHARWRDNLRPDQQAVLAEVQERLANGERASEIVASLTDGVAKRTPCNACEDR